MHRVYGHERLLDRISSSLSAGKYPQATLLTGPSGVGKQRVALWTAQGILCDGGPGAPCGRCHSCQQVDRLSHPDLHWLVPIPRPKASEPDKQVEEAAGLLAEVMAERRANPLYSRPEGLVSHAIASVRLLHRIVAVRPFQGQHRAIVLGDAERLVVQEASPEAANALLKLLEEPPAGTYLLLTSSEPQGLLPTVRSRLVPVRIGGVGDDAVRRFLAKELDPPPKGEALEQRVVAAEGSIGRALAGSSSSGAMRAAERTLAAFQGGGARSWARAALAQAPWSARGEFTAMLDAMAHQLRAGLIERVAADHAAARRTNLAIREVEEIRALAQGNVNPQLALAVLARRLERLAA